MRERTTMRAAYIPWKIDYGVSIRFVSNLIEFKKAFFYSSHSFGWTEGILIIPAEAFNSFSNNHKNTIHCECFFFCQLFTRMDDDEKFNIFSQLTKARKKINFLK